MELIISTLSLAFSALSLALVWFQVRVATKTMKAQIAVSLIDQLYSDPTIQNDLFLIYSNSLKYFSIKETKQGLIKSIQSTEEKDITTRIDILLNRFQIIGHSFHLGVLNLEDLRGIRYEIIRIGRNQAIRDYLQYLNTDYQERSGVMHDHFSYFKELYEAFEYDRSYRESFVERLHSSDVRSIATQ